MELRSSGRAERETGPPRGRGGRGRGRGPGTSQEPAPPDESGNPPPSDLLQGVLPPDESGNPPPGDLLQEVLPPVESKSPPSGGSFGALAHGDEMPPQPVRESKQLYGREVKDHHADGLHQLTLTMSRSLEQMNRGPLRVQNFDGTGDLSLPDWLSMLEEGLPFSTDEVKISVARQHLSASTLIQRLLGARKEEKSTWRGFTKVLLGDVEDKLEDEWDCLKMTSTVEEYYLRFQSLLRRRQVTTQFELSEAAKMRKLRKGLLPEIGRACAATSFYSVKDLMDAAKRVEHFHGSGANSQVPLNSVSLQPSQPAAADPEQKYLLQRFHALPSDDQGQLVAESKLTAQPLLSVYSIVMAQGGKCFACGEMGHWRGQCKKRAAPGTAATPEPKRHRIEKPCHFFNTSAGCWRGKDCTFEHVREEPKTATRGRAQERERGHNRDPSPRDRTGKSGYLHPSRRLSHGDRRDFR